MFSANQLLDDRQEPFSLSKALVASLQVVPAGLEDYPCDAGQKGPHSGSFLTGVLALEALKEVLGQAQTGAVVLSLLAPRNLLLVVSAHSLMHFGCMATERARVDERLLTELACKDLRFGLLTDRWIFCVSCQDEDFFLDHGGLLTGDIDRGLHFMEQHVD